MKTDIVHAHEAKQDLDGIQRTLVLIGLGYAALVALAFYADYKIQMRRARKKREAREAPKRDGDDPPAP